MLATMGDDRWSEVLRWHDSTLRRLFDRFDGQEIKQRGGATGSSSRLRRPKPRSTARSRSRRR